MLKMENLSPSFLSFSALVIFILMLLKLQYSKRSSKSNQTLPPGPWRLPLIGNLHHLISTKLPHHRLRDLSNEYGPLMFLQIGEVPHIIVSSPEIAKEIMKTHDVNFAQRPRILLAGKYYGKAVVFGEFDDRWRMLKKICIEQLLSHKRVQSFRSIREEEVSNVIGDLRLNSGSPVNLSLKIFSLTCSITARAAFGGKCKDQEEFLRCVSEALKLAAGFSISDIFQSRKWIRRICGVRAKFDKLLEALDRVLERIVLERKANPFAENCLLDVLLNIQKNGKLPFPLETDNIKAVILDMFAAGTESGATVVEWAMLEMLKNPRVMVKAQSEVRRVFGKQGNVDEENLHELSYLKMVIKEIFRFHPPGPFVLTREARECCVIAGFHIPAKTRVLVHQWTIGRDTRFWNGDAERFRPERFVDSSVDFKGRDFELIPFGAGRRICPGIGFAIADIELILAQLLFHFDWKLPNGIDHENLDMSESFGTAVRRKEEICVIPLTYNLMPIM